jgi:hypothetical protein
VVVDQVSGSGSDLKARLSIIGDAEVKASLTAHVQSGGMLTMTDFDGHQIAVECVPGTEIAASSRRAELQPHFPQVSLRASSSEISSDLKLICDGRIRKAGTPEEKLDAKEIDVLEVIDGESVILFDKHGTQVSLSVVGENSLKPYYQIRAEGLGKDSQYSFESAGELKRPQTLEVGGRQNSDNGTRVEVTCRPQK